MGRYIVSSVHPAPLKQHLPGPLVKALDTRFPRAAVDITASWVEHPGFGAETQLTIKLAIE